MALVLPKDTVRPLSFLYICYVSPCFFCICHVSPPPPYMDRAGRMQECLGSVRPHRRKKVVQCSI
jgi:hypothetical protein